MKKICALCLALLSLLLCACGAKAAKTRYEEFSAALAEKDDYAFNAGVRAEFDDRSCEFTLEYIHSSDMAVVTIIEPETVHGVTAQIRDGEAALEYQGVMLAVGELDEYGLTPMSALPILADALTDAYVDSCWNEGELLAYTLIPDDVLSINVYFESDTMTPVRAEIASGGRVRVFCEISDWR